MRSHTPGTGKQQNPLSGELLATTGTATGQHSATILGRHAQTETVAAGALEAAGLESTFHRARSLLSLIEFASKGAHYRRDKAGSSAEVPHKTYALTSRAFDLIDRSREVQL